MQAAVRFFEMFGLTAGFLTCTVWTDKLSERDENPWNVTTLTIASMASFAGFLVFMFLSIEVFSRQLLSHAVG